MKQQKNEYALSADFLILKCAIKHILWTSLAFLISEHQMDMQANSAMKHLLLLLKICAGRFYCIISLKLHHSHCHYGINPLPENMVAGNFYYSGN